MILADVFTMRVRGFRVIDLSALVVLLVLALAVYAFKTLAGAQSANAADVQRQIVQEQKRVRLLTAEIAHLEDPSRIERLSTRYLGMAAVDDWEDHFWTNFCRWRRFEHIEGGQCWIEFNGLDFAVLKNVRAFHELLHEILRLMKDRKVLRDNLEMIQWAKSNPRVCEEHVLQFLEVININTARMKLPEEWKRIAAA